MPNINIHQLYFHSLLFNRVRQSRGQGAWGLSPPDPSGGAYSAPPNPLAVMPYF